MPNDNKTFVMDGVVEILSTENNILVATAIIQGWTNSPDQLILMVHVKTNNLNKIKESNVKFVYLKSTEKNWVLLGSYDSENFEAEVEKATDSKERFLVRPI